MVIHRALIAKSRYMLLGSTKNIDMQTKNIDIDIASLAWANKFCDSVIESNI